MAYRDKSLPSKQDFHLELDTPLAGCHAYLSFFVPALAFLQKGLLHLTAFHRYHPLSDLNSYTVLFFPYAIIKFSRISTNTTELQGKLQ